MKNVPAHLYSSDLRFIAITRVCLAVAKTTVAAAWQCRNRKNTTGTDVNRSPWAFLSVPVRHAPRHCVLLQSP
jgi:hypothetical protein